MLPHDFGVFVLYTVVVGIFPGSFLGFLLTPIAYAIFFRSITYDQLFKSVLIIFIVTVFAGTIGALAQDLFAFIAALVGFFAGVLAAFVRIRDAQLRKC